MCQSCSEYTKKFNSYKGSLTQLELKDSNIGETCNSVRIMLINQYETGNFGHQFEHFS